MSSTAARLTVAGLAPFPFIALVILQGLLQPGYSHVVQPISALAALPLGWSQNLNFYILATFHGPARCSESWSRSGVPCTFVVALRGWRVAAQPSTLQ